MSRTSAHPAPVFYTLVHTAIGVCALTWNDGGLTRVQLPEASVHDTERRMHCRGAELRVETLPATITNCITELEAYCNGQRADFDAVPLDTSALTPFDIAVYQALRRVAWGHTTTYGALAAAVGEPAAARAVGVAMSRNAWPIIVPCHRVLAAHGAMGGFSAYGGTLTKQRLLTIEGNGLDALPLFAP